MFLRFLLLFLFLCLFPLPLFFLRLRVLARLFFFLLLLSCLPLLRVFALFRFVFLCSAGLCVLLCFLCFFAFVLLLRFCVLSPVLFLFRSALRAWPLWGFAVLSFLVHLLRLFVFSVVFLFRRCLVSLVCVVLLLFLLLSLLCLVVCLGLVVVVVHLRVVGRWLVCLFGFSVSLPSDLRGASPFLHVNILANN